jgi:hypothetical protein
MLLQLAHWQSVATVIMLQPVLLIQTSGWNPTREFVATFTEPAFLESLQQLPSLPHSASNCCNSHAVAACPLAVRCNSYHVAACSINTDLRLESDSGVRCNIYWARFPRIVATKIAACTWVMLSRCNIYWHRSTGSPFKLQHCSYHVAIIRLLIQTSGLRLKSDSSSLQHLLRSLYWQPVQVATLQLSCCYY